MLWTDHWSSGPDHDALWRMIAQFWSRHSETFFCGMSFELTKTCNDTGFSTQSFGICVWGGWGCGFGGLFSPLFGDVE